MKCQMGWNKKFLHHRAKWKKERKKTIINIFDWVESPLTIISRLLQYSTIHHHSIPPITYFLSLMISYTCFSSSCCFSFNVGVRGAELYPTRSIYVLSIYLLLLLLRLQYSLKINTFRQTLVPLLLVLVVGYVYIFLLGLIKFIYLELIFFIFNTFSTKGYYYCYYIRLYILLPGNKNTFDYLLIYY